MRPTLAELRRTAAVLVTAEEHPVVAPTAIPPDGAPGGGLHVDTGQQHENKKWIPRTCLRRHREPTIRMISFDGGRTCILDDQT